jgi:hypothetical protein
MISSICAEARAFRALIVLASLGLGSTVPALADAYSLTVDHCSGGCGTAPFATIDVTQAGANYSASVWLALRWRGAGE